MNEQKSTVKELSPTIWISIILCSLAGGMGWGIRGQYGHESGAMIAGHLVSAVVALLFCRNLSAVATLRAMAWSTIAFGIGGSMSYGQTIGLTQEAEFIGNWQSWRWGMLGLAIKGGIWIGIAGVFLGMGLGGIGYTSLEILFVFLCTFVLYFIGVFMLNSPMDPKTGVVPFLYFSNPVVKPRFECWGGLLFALLGLLTYAFWVRRDLIAARMGLFGFLGGFIGFPLGQCLQSWHAWNPEWFGSGPWAQWDHLVNWWSLMEITFGLVMGGFIGLGLWQNRQGIGPSIPDQIPPIAKPFDWIFLVVHLLLLSLSEFGENPIVNEIYGLGLGMALIPMVFCSHSILWGAFLLGPVTVLPIAGKTLRRMVLDGHTEVTQGWILYFLFPMVLSLVFSFCLLDGIRKGRGGSWIGAFTLGFGSLVFYGLNFAFFDFPWPWNAWTARTPGAIVFFLCLAGLMLGILVNEKKRSDDFGR